MKQHLGMLSLFVLLCGCAGHRWSFDEGPMRLQARCPYSAYVNQSYSCSVIIAGTIPDVPMLIRILVDGDPMAQGTTDYLRSRFYDTYPLVFDKEYYLFRRGWSRQMPGAHDTIEEVPYLTVPDASEDVFGMDVKFEFGIDIWEAEPHPTDPTKWRRIRKLCDYNKTVKLECMECTPPTM